MPSCSPQFDLPTAKIKQEEGGGKMLEYEHTVFPCLLSLACVGNARFGLWCVWQQTGPHTKGNAATRGQRAPKKSIRETLKKQKHEGVNYSASCLQAFNILK